MRTNTLALISKSTDQQVKEAIQFDQQARGRSKSMNKAKGDLSLLTSQRSIPADQQARSLSKQINKLTQINQQTKDRSK